MVIKVYVSLISFSQEVKKNQQRALMILESKNIPFVTIDITDPGSEDAKEYMNENARPKGNNKVPMTPQIFNDAELCGDFEELDMANECDTLGEFLKLTDEQKKTIRIGITSLVPGEENKHNESQMTNGVSASQEAEVNNVSNSAPAEDSPKDEERNEEVANVNEEEEVANDDEGKAVNEDAVEEIREEVKEDEKEEVKETHEAEADEDKVEEEEAGKEEEEVNKGETKEANKDELEETTKEDNSVTTKSNKEEEGEEA